VANGTDGSREQVQQRGVVSRGLATIEESQFEKVVSNEVNDRLVELEEEFEKRIDVEKEKQRMLRIENEKMETEFNEKLYEAGQTIQMLNDQLEEFSAEKNCVDHRGAEWKDR